MKLRFKRMSVAVSIAACASSSLAVTGMKYVSTPGDPVGQGQSGAVVAPQATVTSYGNGHSIHVSAANTSEFWNLDFTAPKDEMLAPGSYPDAAANTEFSSIKPVMNVSTFDVQCFRLKGWFHVLEYEVDADGHATKLAIDFVQNCNTTMPPLYGSVRINSDLPLVVPEMSAVAGPDDDVFGGEPVSLDATQSFSRKHAPLTYQWTQVGGQPVALDDPSSPTPSFVAPLVGKKGDTLRFRLDATEASGKTSHDSTIVVVESASTPRNQVSFHGDPGDPITLGQSYSYDPRTALIQPSTNFDRGVSMQIDSAEMWLFDSATPSGTAFGPGTYLNAERFPGQGPDSPGLSFATTTRSCTTVTGQFTVYQYAVDKHGNVRKLDMSFEQHCEGALPGTYGRLLVNAVPQELMVERLRAARRSYGQ